MRRLPRCLTCGLWRPTHASPTPRLLISGKTPLKGRHPCKLGFYLCKSEILNKLFNITLLKGARLGLLTPSLVVYPLIYGQVTLVTFCINKRSKDLIWT
jgi:hypothetical protein